MFLLKIVCRTKGKKLLLQTIKEIVTMQSGLRNALLRHEGVSNGVSLYTLDCPGAINKYMVVSHSTSRELMRSPEVVGFDAYQALLAPTSETLRFLLNQGLSSRVNIFTILRGGLNYPLEECCHEVGIQVDNIDFFSCERVFDGDAITGLDIRYEKVASAQDCTLLIGDIFASGSTFAHCFRHFVSELDRQGGCLRRVVFFTVGGTRLLPLAESLTEEMRELWPGFEGFTCIFYEGIFSVYEDHGCTGVNRPEVDFGWQNGVVSPEFRRCVLEDDDALFEKCIIYDGGARRYTIPEHYEEVVEYWESIREAADSTSMDAFVSEKLGYDEPSDFDSWLALTHYASLPVEEMKSLYALESTFRQHASGLSLAAVAERRLEEFTAVIGKYR